MTRWALHLEYDGAGFVGWQLQENGISLQAVLEQAASRLAGGAAGARASWPGAPMLACTAAGQVAMIELPDRYSPAQVRDALNFHMQPHPIVVLRAAAGTRMSWNPRFLRHRPLRIAI